MVSLEWNPSNPGIFYSRDISGNLFLWDLFIDVKKPIFWEKIGDSDVGPCKWHISGQKLVYAQDKNKIIIR